MGQRRIKSVKEEGSYNKINRDLFEIVSNYKKYTTKREWRYYLLIPLSISIIVFAFIGFLANSNTQILKTILDINQISMSVLAILAGFSTTSLSIIAASNNKVLRYLQSVKLENSNASNETVLKQVVSFFSFSIIYQIVVLIAGILLVMLSKNLKDFSILFSFLHGMDVRIPLLILGVIWLSAILFALIISLRNTTLLYRYVLFIAEYRDEKED